MSRYTPDQYYTDLGLKLIHSDHLNQIIERNMTHPAVRRFAEVRQGQIEFGDDEANVAFYHCFYTERVPELGLTWSQAYAGAYFPLFERVSLPDLEYFCRAHEARTAVLDVGCGDGFALCYLARVLPAVRFVGVDRCVAALDHARERVKRLGLANIELYETEAFTLPKQWRQRFDGAILRNIVDDTRERKTPWHKARFGTTDKLRAIRPVVQRNARLYVSMTPYPADTLDFEAKVQADLAAAGYHAPSAQRLSYQSGGSQSLAHLVWTLTPADKTRESGEVLEHRPEYVTSYHYAKGEAIPVEDVVLAEECYVNLDNPRWCPRCSAQEAGVIYSGGPARTHRNFYKVAARVYSCPACQYGYTVAEVID